MKINYTSGMNTLAERLEHVFKVKNKDGKVLTKTGLWKACGLSSGAVSQWFSGGTKDLKGDNLLSAAIYLGVSPEWLSTGKGDPFSKKQNESGVPQLKEPVMIAGMRINSNEQNLIEMYRKLSLNSQLTIELVANRLSELEHPGDRKYAPYPEKPKQKEKQK